MTKSCQVDFYVLSSPGLDARQMACRLALMSWERGHRTLVIAETESEARELDDLMWESPPGRFLPHTVNGEAGSSLSSANAPVCIGLLEGLQQDELSGFNVAINLCTQPVPNPHHFSRLLEIVPQRDEARKASRLKFKFYRDQGISPESHEINK